MENTILADVLAYIDDHIHDKISLGELAELAGYSPFYFSKMFSEAMGMPVTGYVRIRKLQHAIVDLLEGKKVLDVSLLYAFDSHEGFTRAFTKLFGVAPRTVRKHLPAYKVPDRVAFYKNERRKEMEISKKDNLQDNMQQLVYEVLSEALLEASEGYCTEIDIKLLQDGSIRILDNGRGIPLTQNRYADKDVLDKILTGRPISNLEYSQMEDFVQLGLQTVNSLCESLQLRVYRDGTCFKQDYVRGIPQHEISSEAMKHDSGTEIILKPDRAIFGDTMFSVEMLREWIDHKTINLPQLKVQLG